MVIIIAAAVICAAALLCVGIIDGNRFVIKEETFTLPKLSKDCCFVMISDLHNKVYGQRNEKVIAAIDAVDPDFIVIAGDLVTSHVKESIDPGAALVNALSRKYKIYYGMGNHETKLKLYPEQYGDKYEKLEKGIAHPNVKILANETCILPQYHIALTGIEIGREYFSRFIRHRMLPGYLEKLVGKPQEDYSVVCIAHNPDYFEEYAAWGADLVLSGHVHGGIMRLPILGGVISPSYTLFPKYDGGIFTKDKAVMLLGRGMGSHTIPLRFFNPAELHVVHLKKKEIVTDIDK